MRKHSDAEFKFPESVPDILKQNFIEQNRWEFGMIHKTTDSSMEYVTLPMDSESTGTKNLFGVGARVLDILSRELGRDPQEILQDGKGTVLLTGVTKGGNKA